MPKKLPFHSIGTVNAKKKIIFPLFQEMIESAYFFKGKENLEKTTTSTKKIFVALLVLVE